MWKKFTKIEHDKKREHEQIEIWREQYQEIEKKTLLIECSKIKIRGKNSF